MGILSKLDEFADATAIPTTADTEVVLGDVKDGGLAVHYPANGKRPLYLCIEIDTAVTSGASSSTTFALKSSGAEDLADAGESPTTHWQSAAIPKATLVAGYRVAAFPLPAGPYQRYWGLTTLSDETLTAGKANAWLTYDPPHELVLHPDGLPTGS